MEQVRRETIAEIKERLAAAPNPYANGRGKAILQRLIQDKKNAQEQARREYQENPEIRKMYDRLEQKTIEQNSYGK